MPLGEGKGHCSGHGGDIDLERIKAQVGLPCMVGEPGSEGFKIENPASPIGIAELLLRKKYQGVEGGTGRFATAYHCLRGAALLDTILRQQRG